MDVLAFEDHGDDRRGLLAAARPSATGPLRMRSLPSYPSSNHEALDRFVRIHEDSRTTTNSWFRFFGHAATTLCLLLAAGLWGHARAEDFPPQSVVPLFNGTDFTGWRFGDVSADRTPPDTI